MSAPCIVYDIRSGKRKEIGPIDSVEVKEWLIENAALWQKQPANLAGMRTAESISKVADRFRSSNARQISLNIKGPNGATLVSYEWASEEIEPERKYGATVKKAIRISNWKEAAANAETGRSIVHKFTVKLPDGSTRTVSAESLPAALGYTDKQFEDVFPNAKGLLQSIAKLRMREQSILDYLDSVKDIEKQAEAEARKEQEAKADAEKKRIADDWREKKEGLESAIEQAKGDNPAVVKILQEEIDKGPEEFDDFRFGRSLFDELYRKNVRELGVYFDEIRDAQDDLRKTRDRIENKYKQLAQSAPDSQKAQQQDPVEAYLQSLLDQTKNVTGLNAELYRGMVNAILTTYRAAKDVAKAIQAGIDYLVEQGVSQEEAEAEAEKVRITMPGEKAKPEAKIEMRAEGRGEVTKERKTITSIKKSADISDEVKAAFSEEGANYRTLPNEVSVNESKALIDAMGLSEAKAFVLNPSKDMPAAFRSTMAQVLIKAFNSEKDFVSAVEIAEGIAQMATDWGQGIQALSMLQFLTPEGQLLYAQRNRSKQRQKKFEQHKGQIDKGLSTVKKARKEAVDEAIEKVAGRVEQVAPPPPARPKEYGSTNKIVTKSAYEKARAALRGLFFSAGVPPAELVTVAAYHVEAGSRKFAEFSKAMIADVGRKVKPYLRAAYKAAQAKLGGTGYSTDAEIADYFASQVEKDIKNAIKEAGININQIIREHYTSAEAAKQTLTEKLIEQAGLDPKDAGAIAKAVEVEFNKLAKEKIMKAFAKLYGPIKIRTPKVRTLQDKLIEAANLGAFSDEVFREAYAEAFGFPNKLTDAEANKITQLAEKAQEAKEGRPKLRATEDLLNYQENLKGTDWSDLTIAMYITNLLSGPTTQLKNVAANFFYLASVTPILMARIGAKNPRAVPMLFRAMLNGLKRGEAEFVDVMRTGYSPIKEKAQIGSIFERMPKSNPISNYKYVGRLMRAADVLSFAPLQEMEAYTYAVINNESYKDALAMYGRGDDRIELARLKAEQEYNKTIEEIEKSSDTPVEKRSKMMQAKYDKELRFYEFLDEMRPEEMKSRAHKFAEKGTFNQTPEGTLGAIAKLVNIAISKYKELRLVATFTNVVTNIFNMYVDFSPLGAVRAARGGSIRTGRLDDFDTEEERITYMKAALGTIVAASAFALSQPGDDDEEPLLEITANGYNDFAKNQNLIQNGWKNYSIKFRGSDTYISYQLTPFFPMLAGIGALRDQEKYHKKKLRGEDLDKWGFAFGTMIQSMFSAAGYLEGIGTLADALMDEDSPEKLQDRVGQILGKFAYGLTPVVGSNLYTQFAEKFEEFMDMPEKEFNQVWYGKLVRHLPIARDMLQNRVNALGEELPKNTDFMFFDTPTKHQKLWDLLAKNKASITGESYKTAFYVNDKNERIPMSPDQYYKYMKVRGEFIREKMDEQYDELVKKSPEEFEKWMNLVKRYANAIGKASLTQPNKK